MSADALIPGFADRTARLTAGQIAYSIAGEGPPVLLLHGYPQSRACWREVAPSLAAKFTVVAPDLRGYGDSAKPASDPEHLTYAKRAMAADMAELMAHLGFGRFAVAGHDRGGRVAYRLALDHPQSVKRLAVLDIATTLDTFDRTGKFMALGTYHWFFLAQPFDLPERLIGAEPEFYLRWTLKSWAAPGFRFDDKAMAHYLKAFSDPAARHAMCEDYRAGATRDCENDAADRAAGTRIAAPVLCLWGERRNKDGRDFDYLGFWRPWAHEVRGRALDCGHFLPEERPEEVADELARFFGAPD